MCVDVSRGIYEVYEQIEKSVGLMERVDHISLP